MREQIKLLRYKIWKKVASTPTYKAYRFRKDKLHRIILDGLLSLGPVCTFLCIKKTTNDNVGKISQDVRYFWAEVGRATGNRNRRATATWIARCFLLPAQKATV